MAVDHNNPQSRDEEILIATIDGNEYNKAPQSRMEELLLELKETIEEGGGGGTTNYENLSNQPQVNGETLIGDKTGADLGLVDAEEGKGLSTNDYDDNEKAAVAAATSAISAMKDGTDLDSFGDVEVALLDKADTSDLGTAAAKNSTNAVTAGSTDLVESGAVKDAIDVAVAAAYHHAGTKTVAQLTHDLLVAANEGNVYNITDSGTTTSDFIEGIGKTIDEGSNVGICKVGNAYMFDLLSGFVDTTNFVQKSVTAGLLKNDGTVDTTIQGDIDSLKSGFTALDNEVNGDATTYPYADVITIEDAVPANLADCSVKVEPVQDLHGYDKPWVGGANKNKMKIDLSNDSSSAAGMDFSHTDDTFTLQGTASNAYKIFNFDKVPSIKANLPYVLSVEVTGTMPKMQLSMYVADSQGQSLGSLKVVVSGTGSYSSNAVTFNADVASSTFTIESLLVDGAYDCTVKVQLEQNTQATSWSPWENICPISGHTEAVVEVSAPNRYVDGTASVKVAGNWDIDNTKNAQTSSDYVVNGNTISGTSSGYCWLHIPYSFEAGKTVYFKINGNLGNFRVSNSNGAKKAESVDSAYTPSETFDGFIDRAINPTTFNNAKFGIGYTTDFEIDAYNKKPINRVTIALGDTIYGGTVDFDSGVMTVDREIVDLGGLNWDYFTGSVNYFRTGDLNSTIKRPNSVTDVPNIISSIYTAHQWGGNTPDKNIIVVPSGTTGYDKYLFIRDDSYDNATTYKTAMDGVQLCYELATPTTIQLTPQQIQLLKGTNTLYASTGDISVTVNGVSGAIGAVQEQVNDIAEDVALKQNATDNNLQTTDKTVVGGINELKSGLTNLVGKVVGAFGTSDGSQSLQITFTGNGLTRRTHYAVYICGQTGPVVPIHVALNGQGWGTPEQITNISIDNNLSGGVSVSNNKLIINCTVGGGWGAVRVIDLICDSRESVTLSGELVND